MQTNLTTTSIPLKYLTQTWKVSVPIAIAIDLIVIMFSLTEGDGRSLIIIIAEVARGGVTVIAVATWSGVISSIVLLAIICIILIVLVRKGRKNPSKIVLK